MNRFSIKIKIQNKQSFFKRSVVSLLWFTVFIGVIFLVLYILRHKIVIPCVFNKLTGFYCPGCGAARATNALIHLKILKAFKSNAAYCILMPLIIFYFLARLTEYLFTGENKIDKAIPKKLLYGVFIGLMVFGFLRNIPFVPFKYLAP